MEGDAMNRSDRVPASHCVGSLQGQGQPGSPRLEARECFLVECFVLMWRALPRWMVVSGAATSDSRDTR
jgi:hypothetical protein